MSAARRTRRRRRAGLSADRLTVVACIGLLGFAALLARAVQLQTLDAEWLATRAERQGATTLDLEPLRAELRDRDGRPLAVSASVESVAASPRLIQNRRAAARSLAKALRLPAKEVEKRLAQAGSFVWLQRWVTPDAAERVRALALPGIHLHSERRRFYPNGSLGGPVLGFADRDGRGLSGVELLFDRELRGAGAELVAKRDGGGRVLPNGTKPPETRAGQPITLALDLELQHFAEKALAESLRKTGARHATLVALDPRNGEILALAESPSFDPNRFWLEDSSAYRARAFVDTFEPGSTFKPFSIAVALEAGVTQPSEVFDCENGRFRIGRRTIRDHHPYELLTVSDILRVSSNIGMAKLTARLGARRLVDGVRKFGFGRTTGSGFPGEVGGNVRQIRDKQAIERANLSFGQGVTVTPIQLVTAMAVFANEGRRVTPRITRASPQTPDVAAERVLSERTTRIVLEMMRRVVEDGTGKAAALPHVDVAGKTGTAQKVKDGSYSQSDYVASFVGIVPVVNPRLVIGVFIDEPRGFRTGGAVAAPVFREVAGYAVDRLGIGRGAPRPVKAKAAPARPPRVESRKNPAGERAG
ncbi:MAG: penicillin-binding protein 2 [Myxococcota bacterium]